MNVNEWMALGFEKQKFYFADLIVSCEDEKIDKLFTCFPEFFTLPASTKYHGSFEGGLMTHTYFVVQEAKNLYERMVHCDPCSMSRDFVLSLTKVAILHDVGKMGQLNDKGELIPTYLKKENRSCKNCSHNRVESYHDTTEDCDYKKTCTGWSSAFTNSSFENYEGKEKVEWIYNEKMPLKMEHELQSLFFCQLFKIKLSCEEVMVITHHTGAYSTSHQYIDDSKSQLQVILHQADNFCAKVLNV